MSSKEKERKSKGSRHVLELKAKLMDLQERNKALNRNNKQLVEQVNVLMLDKGELKSKLEEAQKRNGGSVVDANTEQWRLADGMKASVRNLVQRKFFPLWPFLDKQTFSKGNLMAPATKFLTRKDVILARLLWRPGKARIYQ